MGSSMKGDKKPPYLKNLFDEKSIISGEREKYF
jgi:hypothetical protein